MTRLHEDERESQPRVYPENIISPIHGVDSLEGPTSESVVRSSRPQALSCWLRGLVAALFAGGQEAAEGKPVGALGRQRSAGMAMSGPGAAVGG